VQSVHASPPDPQAVSSPDVLQFPVMSQQPLHDVGLHDPGAAPSSPSGLAPSSEGLDASSVVAPDAPEEPE
jgi:hypothetical protein